MKELPCYKFSQDNNKTTKSQESICIQVSHKCKNRVCKHLLKIVVGTTFHQKMHLFSIQVKYLFFVKLGMKSL